MQSLPRDVSVNLERIGQAAAAVAGTRGASLLVVPELALIGYGAGDALGDRAETPAGEQAQSAANAGLASTSSRWSAALRNGPGSAVL